MHDDKPVLTRQFNVRLSLLATRNLEAIRTETREEYTVLIHRLLREEAERRAAARQAAKEARDG